MNCACGVLPPFLRERGETLHEVLSELYAFAGDPEVKLTLSTWVSGCHVSPRLPLRYRRKGFTATWPTRAL